jgi:vitamin K-dependent gamma-carboxylase
MSNQAVVGNLAQDIAGDSFWGRWFGYLNEPIDGASLAVFRMWFAICLVANVWLYQTAIERDYLQPKLFFPFIPDLHPWPGSGMLIHFGVMAVSAAMIGLGWFYRPATIVFLVAQTYLFLLEKAYYQNHFYLICLLAFLFCFIPADRVWSLDTPKDSKNTDPIPRWSLLILKIQIFIVYFYAGIAKLNTDWLIREQPQTMYFQVLGTDTIFGHAFAHPWFVHLVVRFRNNAAA